MKRRTILATAIPMGLWLPQLTKAESTATPAEGNDYVPLSETPALLDADGKVHVLEFFSYACPACRGMEPELQAWKTRLEGRIRFERAPMPMAPFGRNQQKAYYALTLTGMPEEAHARIFSLLQEDPKNLENLDRVADMATGFGLARAKFMDIAESSDIDQRITANMKLAVKYRINSMPTLVIQQKYLTSSALTKSHQRTLDVAEFLVGKIRAAS